LDADFKLETKMILKADGTHFKIKLRFPLNDNNTLPTNTILKALTSTTVFFQTRNNIALNSVNVDFIRGKGRS